MEVVTGQTVYENVLSLDGNNNPVSGATFDTLIINNGQIFTGAVVTMTLLDATRGIFSASWSSDTLGDYQIYIKNNDTNTIFISDIVNVTTDSNFEQHIFVGI